MNNVLSTTGMLTGVIGGLLIALNIDAFVLGYTLFLISSISWVIYSIRTGQINLLLLNSVFAIINAIGFYNFS